MAAGDYTHGEMNVDAQKSMYVGTMKAGLWGALIIALGLAYSTFTLSLGMNWLVSLVICAGTGLVVGFSMGMGGAWIATVIALSGLAMIIQLIVTLVKLAI